MRSSSVAVVMVVLAAPRGVFRRRQRDEWLGELADIRTAALGEHAAALDDHPAADGSQPPPEVLPPDPDPADDMASDPAPEALVSGDTGSTDSAPTDAASVDSASVDSVSAEGQVTEDDPVLSSSPGNEPADPAPQREGHGESDLAELGGGTAADDPPSGWPEPDASPVPIDVDVDVDVDGSAMVGTDTADDADPDPDDLAARGSSEGETVAGAAPSVRPPEPHREHPGELWHPAITLAAGPVATPAPEELVDPVELAGADDGGTYEIPTSVPAESVDGASVRTLGDLFARESGGRAIDLSGGEEAEHLDLGNTRAYPVPPADVLHAWELMPTDAGGVSTDSPPEAEDVEAPETDGTDEVAEAPRRIPPSDTIFDGPPRFQEAAADVGAAASTAEAHGGDRRDDSAGSPSVVAAGQSSARRPDGAIWVPEAGSTSAQGQGGAASGEATGDAGRSLRARRSLFGPIEDPEAPGALAAQPVPADSGSSEDAVKPVIAGLDRLDVNDDGTVALESGIVRLAPEATREVSILNGSVGLTLERGWCWIASSPSANPVVVTLRRGTLLIPPGTSCLSVVESDGSVFVSVVRGSACLDRPGTSVDLPVGTIAQLRSDGTVHTDRATPEEMAADQILTDNLRLDEQLESNGASDGRGRRSEASENQSPSS